MRCSRVVRTGGCTRLSSVRWRVFWKAHVDLSTSTLELSIFPNRVLETTQFYPRTKCKSILWFGSQALGRARRVARARAAPLPSLAAGLRRDRSVCRSFGAGR